MPDQYTDFFAGYFSGIVALVAGNPLDIMKVHLQHFSAKSKESSTSNSRNININKNKNIDQPIKYDRNIWNKQNPLTLLRGLAVPTMSYGALNAVLFSSYSASMIYMKENEYFKNWNIGLKMFVSGMIASVPATVIATPSELIKCRTQLLSNTSSYFVLKSILKYEGVKALYKGGVPTTLRDGIGYGVYFLSYHYGKLLWIPELKGNDSYVDFSNKLNIFKILLIGGISGALSWIFIMPLDVIKTRYQTDIAYKSIQRYKSPWDCCKKLYKEGG